MTTAPCATRSFRRGRGKRRHRRSSRLLTPLMLSAAAAVVTVGNVWKMRGCTYSIFLQIGRDSARD
jgi:hypothetical protein